MNKQPTHCECGYKYNGDDIKRNIECVGHSYEEWLCEQCDFESDPT